MGAFSATRSIQQNNIGTSPIFASGGLLRKIYSSKQSQSFAAYQILASGGRSFQNTRVEKYNKKNNITYF